jgi:hypothetical protein
MSGSSMSSPGDDDEGGSGLAIVAALATRWGVDPAEGGKTTWFWCEARGG